MRHASIVDGVTVDEVDELVRQVAEKCMGWNPPKQKEPGRYLMVLEDEELKIGKQIGWRHESGKFYSMEDWEDLTYWKDSEGSYVKIGNNYLLNIIEDWQPDTDMNHLWMVVERMRELGRYLIVWQYAVFYEVTFSQGSGTEDTIFNSNFNIAVLKAALKAAE